MILNKNSIGSSKVLEIFTELPTKFTVITLDYQNVKEIELQKLYGLVNQMKPLVVNAINFPLKRISFYGYLEAIGYELTMISLESAQRSIVELNREKYYLQSYAKNRDFFVLNTSDNNLTKEVKVELINRLANFFNRNICNVINQSALQKLAVSGDKCLVPSVYNKVWMQNLLSKIGGL